MRTIAFALAALIMLSAAAHAAPLELLCSEALEPCTDVVHRWLAHRVVVGSSTIDLDFLQSLTNTAFSAAINDPASYAALAAATGLPSEPGVDWAMEWVALLHSGPRNSEVDGYLRSVRYDPTLRLHVAHWTVEETGTPEGNYGVSTYAVARAAPGLPAVALFCEGPSGAAPEPFLDTRFDCATISPS